MVLAACPGGDDSDDGVEPTDEPWRVSDEPGEEAGSLLSVWGASEDDVRAVGGQIDSLGEAGTGVMLLRNGEAWETETIPDDTPVLNWIHGADGILWAVGNEGAAIRQQGGSWERDDTGATVPLWGVFVLSADEAWAVGGDPFDTDGTGVLFHYTGGAWEEVELPELDRDAPAIFKVWASSPSDVHAVGDNGVIMHFDGSEWVQVASGTGADLISLWGTGADEILAVGGRANGVIARYDGSGWTSTMLAMAPPLNGIWMDSEGVSYLAGERGTILRVAAGANEAEMVETPARLETLHAIFGFDEGSQISVGGTLMSPPPYSGLILERP